MKRDSVLPKFRRLAKVLAPCSCFLALVAVVSQTGRIQYRTFGTAVDPSAPGETKALTNSSRSPGQLKPLNSRLASVAATDVLNSHRSEADRRQISTTYGNLPLSFEANQGQADQRAKFLARGSGYA